MARQTVRIGSRQIVVDKTPLHVSYLACGVHEFILSQPEDGQLTLHQGRGVRVLGWIFSVLGWPVILLGLLAVIGLLMRPSLENLPGTLCLLGWGLPFVFFGVKLLGRRCRFDTRTGELTIRHFARTRRRPLADILAVQVIDAGVFGSNNSEGDERFISYQFNLVLDDDNESRLFLAFHQDNDDMAKKAKQLAEFLGVPLLMPTRLRIPPKEKVEDSIPSEPRADPTRNWAETNTPMPSFDLATGALGGLRLGDEMEMAEFLGRPDRVDQTAAPRWVSLDYAGRGFTLVFENGQFMELFCTLARHTADATPEPGQGFSRPRLSGGIELTPEMDIAQVQQYFGPPESEENYTRGRALTYRRERFSMEFEFEQTTERLLDWSAKALDD